MSDFAADGLLVSRLVIGLFGGSRFDELGSVASDLAVAGFRQHQVYPLNAAEPTNATNTVDTQCLQTSASKPDAVKPNADKAHAIKPAAAKPAAAKTNTQIILINLFNCRFNSKETILKIFDA